MMLAAKAGQRRIVILLKRECDQEEPTEEILVSDYHRLYVMTSQCSHLSSCRLPCQIRIQRLNSGILLSKCLAPRNFQGVFEKSLNQRIVVVIVVMSQKTTSSVYFVSVHVYCMVNNDSSLISISCNILAATIFFA